MMSISEKNSRNSDSSNPGNRYTPKNKAPKNLEKSGINKKPKIVTDTTTKNTNGGL